MNPAIADLRLEYSRAQLTDTDPDPFKQFANWFDEARKAEVPEANAMSVSTADAGGRPSSRILLIKDFGPEGFTWFTNYRSRKGHDLDANPYAALLFFWIPLERQVRIEGRVERVPAAESEAYFNSRPVGSRLGAIASSQSEAIADRAALEKQYQDAQQQYGDQPKRPEHWGGYRLVPDLLEFWQGRPSRLHDRIQYVKEGNSWVRSRLQP